MPGKLGGVGKAVAAGLTNRRSGRGIDKVPCHGVGVRAAQLRR
jgi:hypothetical protein